MVGSGPCSTECGQRAQLCATHCTSPSLRLSGSSAHTRERARPSGTRCHTAVLKHCLPGAHPRHPRPHHTSQRLGREASRRYTCICNTENPSSWHTWRKNKSPALEFNPFPVAKNAVVGECLAEEPHQSLNRDGLQLQRGSAPPLPT